MGETRQRAFSTPPANERRGISGNCTVPQRQPDSGTSRLEAFRLLARLRARVPVMVQRPPSDAMAALATAGQAPCSMRTRLRSPKPHAIRSSVFCARRDSCPQPVMALIPVPACLSGVSAPKRALSRASDHRDAR